jgi:hypothetical protein
VVAIAACLLAASLIRPRSRRAGMPERRAQPRPGAIPDAVYAASVILASFPWPQPSPLRYHDGADPFGRHILKVRRPNGHHPASASRPASVIRSNLARRSPPWRGGSAAQPRRLLCQFGAGHAWAKRWH